LQREEEGKHGKTKQKYNHKEEDDSRESRRTKSFLGRAHHLQDFGLKNNKAMTL
jgi:hypothetical protein